MMENGQNQKFDTSIYGMLAGFHLMGGVAFLVITILTLFLHVEIIYGMTWWWSLIITILCFLFGFAWFNVMGTFDNITTRLEELEQEKKSDL